jgi:IS30 family transposase
MRVPPETIYQSVYVQGQGALRRELAVCLRTGRAVRRPREGSADRRTRVPGMVMISERPAAAADRAVPGHWEGDLMTGTPPSSVIGTLVERRTRFVLLLHLPAGPGADAVAAAMTDAMAGLPAALRRSLAGAKASELAGHVKIAAAAGLDIYFCDPQSPWHRGSGENTSGLLREFFPVGTSLAGHSREDLDEAAARLNGRPRKALGFKSPAQALAAALGQAAAA